MNEFANWEIAGKKEKICMPYWQEIHKLFKWINYVTRFVVDEVEKFHMGYSPHLR